MATRTRRNAIDDTDARNPAHARIAPVATLGDCLCAGYWQSTLILLLRGAMMAKGILSPVHDQPPFS
ncbi:MAG: hypothetical protein ABNH26_15165 [Celeribacter sp.]